MMMLCVFLVGEMTNDQLLLCIGSYMDIIDHVKKVIRASGRKSYTMVMGKLNVAKMANFMEVDCYVLVACPENSLIDSKVNIPLSLSFALALAFLHTLYSMLFLLDPFFFLFLLSCSLWTKEHYLLIVAFDLYVCRSFTAQLSPLLNWNLQLSGT